MILTAREKEVQFWIHLGYPNLPGSDVMDQRPPLLPRSEALALLLRELKGKSLRADETRALYDSVKRTREEISTSQASSPLSSAGSRTQTLKLLKSASTTEVRARVPKQHRPLTYHDSTTSLRQRSLVKLSLQKPSPVKLSPQQQSPVKLSSQQQSPVKLPLHQRSPVNLSLHQRSPVKLSLQPRSPVKLSLQQRSPVKLSDGVPPPPRPPPSPLRTRDSSSRITSNDLTSLHKNTIDSWDREFFQGANTDVTIYTSDGHELRAHSTVLMCGSPVLKHMLQEQFRPSTRHSFLNIRGVPFQAVRCFVRFLYSSRCEQGDMEEFALHSLVLAHAYMVPSLKRVCTDNYEHGLLNSDNVVDVLQVARLCDASRLHLLCWRLIVANFKAVSRSDGWRIMKESNPKLEQELVEAVIEAETLVAMESTYTSLSRGVLLCVFCLLSCSISVMTDPSAVESRLKSTGVKKRKVVEHAVLFKLKEDTDNKVKLDIVQGLADLKEDCPKWVVAESAGVILKPSQAMGASVALYMRFFSAEDLDVYFVSEQKTDMSAKYIMPYLTDEFTLDYEAEVDDNDDAVYRKGHAFKNGAERVVGIRVKNGTSQEDIDIMIKSLNDLNNAPQLSSLLVQITAGTNFCARDRRYTHGLVVRCPSLKALEEYSKHPHHIDVLTKTVWPIAEKLMSADYVVNESGGRTSIL